MPTPAHHRGRVAATLGASLSHFWLAVLAALGLLNYTVPTPYDLIETAASTGAWAWIHGTCALLLIGSLVYGPKKHLHLKLREHQWRCGLPMAALACNFGFAMLVTWAFFHLLWGLTTVRPVSLAGPGLAFIVAFGEQLLANAWMRGTHTPRR